MKSFQVMPCGCYDNILLGFFQKSLIQNSDIFRTLFIQVYSGILTYIEALLRKIQAYSGIFGTLCKPHIFTTLPYSDPWHI